MSRSKPVTRQLLREMRARGYAWADLRDPVSMQEIANELEWELNRGVSSAERELELKAALHYAQRIVEALTGDRAWGWAPLTPDEEEGDW